MNAQRPALHPRTATIAGLAAGAIGIGILWASGMIDFPFFPPPGMLILVGGLLFVAFAPWRWTPAVGVAIGLFMIVGFFASGGVADLTGARGATVSVGLAVQMIGVVVAVVAGVLAIGQNYRSVPA